MTNLDYLSPFRYPGGKADLTGYIHSFAYENILHGRDLVEIFAGGASVSLSLLKAGIVRKATLVEKDPLVAAFWRAVLNDTEELIQLVADTKVDLDLWKKCRKISERSKINDLSDVELGFVALVLNRTCYSGILHAGPIGGYLQLSDYSVGCRFYKSTLIRRIEDIGHLKSKLKCVEADALDYLDRINLIADPSETFLYVDPPYLTMGKRLYRHFFEAADHWRLSESLMCSDIPWLLSYDNHPAIRRLYSGCSMRSFNLKYHVTGAKNGRELLVSNGFLPELEIR